MWPHVCQGWRMLIVSFPIQCNMVFDAHVFVTVQRTVGYLEVTIVYMFCASWFEGRNRDILRFLSKLFSIREEVIWISLRRKGLRIGRDGINFALKSVSNCDSFTIRGTFSKPQRFTPQLVKWQTFDTFPVLPTYTPMNKQCLRSFRVQTAQYYLEKQVILPRMGNKAEVKRWKRYKSSKMIICQHTWRH